jgi:hypothetical protein
MGHLALAQEGGDSFCFIPGGGKFFEPHSSTRINEDDDIRILLSQAGGKEEEGQSGES